MNSGLHRASARAGAGFGTGKSNLGFTLFELVVVISIISILGGSFLNRVLYYQEQAERSAMVEVAAAVQTALILQFGRLMIHHRNAEIPAMAVENPMDWLVKKPPNYAGEFFAPTPASAPPGSWLFDLKSRELIFIPALTSYVATGQDGNKWIRYRVAVKRNPAYFSAGRPAGVKEFVGVRFEQVEPNLWSS